MQNTNKYSTWSGTRKTSIYIGILHKGHFKTIAFNTPR